MQNTRDPEYSRAAVAKTHAGVKTLLVELSRKVDNLSLQMCTLQHTLIVNQHESGGRKRLRENKS